MNTKITRLLSLGLLILLVAAWLVTPLPALAELQVYSIQPNQVTNTSPVELVITGDDFNEEAVVSLQGIGALPTTYKGPTVLTASLPAGIDPGFYSVTVYDPFSERSVTLPDALQITAGSPDPGEAPFTRPLIVLNTYRSSSESVAPNDEFVLTVKLHNAGGLDAANVLITFAPGDFVPRETGGVLALEYVRAGDTKRIEQPLVAGWEILGKSVATVSMQVSYTDPSGVAYTETFNIVLPVTPARAGPSPTPTPTATPIPVIRPQLVINSYNTNVLILQPGSKFKLDMQISNVGNTDAERVTMILGGGSSASGSPSTTPEAGSTPGGVSGGSGDFGNFAPVSASNVQFLGDLATGASFPAHAELIVNASTNPGAYPMKISFSYNAENGISFTDEQVITLLVYSLPQVEVNYYRDPGPMFAGQPNMVPLQVVNLGRKTTVLGNMRVSVQSAQISNNVTLIGALDPGGYYTLDPMLIPDQPGMLDLLVTIDYTDDFNQSQTITRTITVEVMEGMSFEPMPGQEGMPGEEGFPMGPPATDETIFQKIVRFLKGLFGLDSSLPTQSPGEMYPDEMYPEEGPPGERMPAQPVPSEGGKG